MQNNVQFQRPAKRLHSIQIASEVILRPLEVMQDKHHKNCSDNCLILVKATFDLDGQTVKKRVVCNRIGKPQNVNNMYIITVYVFDH